jgi:geranylgeranyl diphosphate synthase type II
VGYDSQLVHRVLSEAQRCVGEEITALVERNRATGYGPLYDLVADYPFREGKGLRPAIVLASARAAGGRVDQAQVAAAALELYHNAFLIHDDVEDSSDYRRGRITMLRSHGAAVAVNVGDATNVLAMQLLLRNTETIGLHRALLVLAEVERMARESVEGQAIELGWIARHEYELTDADYVRMAHKKTCWYTVIAPLRIGVLCGHPAGVGYPLPEELLPLTELGHLAGIAFQISDDLLNLESDQEVYGKEIAGDLWEGKRTVMLLHFLRNAPAGARDRAINVLSLPREEKDPAEVGWMLEAMDQVGSLDHGHRMAEEYAERAIEADARGMPFYHADGDDRRFLREMLRYVVERIK